MGRGEKGHIVVFMTASSADEGANIGKKTVEEGLAACCNIVPSIRSIYVWKGKLCDEPEALCVFKTRAELFERLRARIKELHSYEVPEIIALKIEAGHADYLKWIDVVTGARK